MLVTYRMSILICYTIIMGPIHFVLPGAHSMLKPALAVIINSLIYANKLLNKFEDTAKYIGVHIKSDKTEYMCLNHEN